MRIWEEEEDEIFVQAAPRNTSHIAFETSPLDVRKPLRMKAGIARS
jgi:hypothetical protein